MWELFLSYQFQTISWLLLVTTIISILIAFAAWQKRGTLVAKYLTLMECGIAIWAFSAFFETSATELSHILIWAQISYLGITTAPLFYFLLALAYGKHYQLLIPRNIILLSIIPFFTLVMVATNNWHHLWYTSISIDPNSNMPIYGYSIWFWLYASYIYVLLAIGVVLLIRTILSVPSIYKSQIIILIIGAILPFTGNLIYVFKINPIPGVDWTPIAFGFSGLFLTWGIFEFQLLNLLPVARNKLVQIMPNGVLVTDFQGIIVDFNPAMQLITGIPAKKAIGQRAEQVLANWEDFINCFNVKTDEREEVYLIKGKTKYYYDMQNTLLYDRNKRPAGQVIMLRDITEKKQAEDILRQSEERYRSLSEQLSESNSMKELLLDVISHDLKNPAWMIKEFTEIAVENDPNNETLQEISLGTNNLLAIIANATTLSKVTVGDTIEKKELDLTNIINVIIQEFSPHLQYGEITLDMKIEKELIVTANPIIGEVFRNYISNAIKYAKSGKNVIIDANIETEYVIVNVKDFGKTIEKKNRENIFIRKVQLDKSKGWGLGLAIVKRIAEAHDAEVGVKPNKPTGNIFFIKIPKT